MSNAYPRCPYCGKEMTNMRKVTNRKYAKNKNGNITVCFDGEASYSYVCNCEGWNKQDLIEYKIEKLQNEINSEYEKLKSLQKNSLMNIMKDKAREKIESGQEEIRNIGKKFCDFNGKSFGVNKINNYLDKVEEETKKKNLDDKINKSLNMKPKGFSLKSSFHQIRTAWGKEFDIDNIDNKKPNIGFIKYLNALNNLDRAYITYLSPLCHIDEELAFIKICYKAAINNEDGFYVVSNISGKEEVKIFWKNEETFETICIMSWDNTEGNLMRVEELLKNEE